MNRLAKCINYQLKSMLKGTVIYLLFYYVISLLISTLVSIQESGSVSVGGGSFYISGIIFTFVYVIADYKESFNYLMMFGNTRRNIFLASTLRSIAMSVFLSIVSILTAYADAIISDAFKPSAFKNESIFYAIYGNSSKAAEFLWFAAFLIAICSFSMLYGSLAYKLGKIFVTAFWVCFGASFVILPLLMNTNLFETLLAAAKAFFCIGNPDGLLLAPLNFIITAVILGAATFLLTRRQPQAA